MDKAKKKTEKDLTSLMGKFEGDLLFPSDDAGVIDRLGLFGEVQRKRARYWCFHLRKVALGESTNPEKTKLVPKGFKEFVEGLKGFSSWEKFAETWDLYGENPFLIVHRLLSVWKEWDQVMDRVSVPVDATPEEIEARVQSLTHAYAKKMRK